VAGYQDSVTNATGHDSQQRFLISSVPRFVVESPKTLS
jgi:hypothetical protein